MTHSVLCACETKLCNCILMWFLLRIGIPESDLCSCNCFMISSKPQLFFSLLVVIVFSAFYCLSLMHVFRTDLYDVESK
ncbi:hypothetical protein PRUPE_7G237600 [Prunus persica]|uniref:Uncharacterized protein n=1 Tax=Prunus persica TaxID=3760 RepID=A0A251NHW9_PRUPE|nr:hypothetical protein PRUPE_7G237600 [Prunus persica]